MKRISEIAHAVTVDVEDWEQSSWDTSTPITDRVTRNTETCLALLRRYRCRATFFVLGRVAEQRPEVVRAIVADGHDVESHGYAHVRVDRHTPEEFRDDLRRSREVIEPLSGRRMTAYRAPDFSISRKNPWALDVLLDEGFELDSSVFPMRMPRYGAAGIPVEPHHLTAPSGRTILEAPVSVLDVFGVRVPIGGGGYFRLFPGAFIRAAVRHFGRRSVPAVLYFHPYEFAPLEVLQEMVEVRHKVPWTYRIHQAIGRKRLGRTLETLLKRNSFLPLKDVIRPERVRKVAPL